MASEAKDNDGVCDRGTVVEDRLQGKPLENVHTSLIKPSTATPSEKEWLSLSSLDYLWVSFYTPLLCVFPLKEHRFGSAAGVVQHLKDSLADALVLFYPLAGRVVTTGGPPRIHCNDEGAVFTEASVDVELAELKTDDFQPVPLLSGMAGAGMENYPAISEMPAGRPALIVQVTHFKCGGITLAANWTHAAADGRAGFHFMKSWAEIARGVEVSVLPDHRRELVKPRDPPILSPIKAETLSPGAKIQEKEKAKKKQKAAEKGEEKPAEVTRTKPRIGTKVVEFTKDEVAELRQMALNQDPSLHLSRADCLTTHLWRSMVRARKLPADALLRLWIHVEGRQKLSLSPGYFGNVLGVAAVMATAGELLNDPFTTTASLVHSAIPTISTDWFRGFIDLITFMKPGNEMSFLPEPVGPGCEMSASYLVRFPFYELDFGFGIPAHSMRNTMGASDGLIFVHPSSRSPDNMVAMVNVDVDVINDFISIAREIPE